jgi:hypothetical protein
MPLPEVLEEHQNHHLERISQCHRSAPSSVKEAKLSLALSLALPSRMSKPSKNVLQLPLEKRAEIAFKIAVAKAIDEHARLGLPVYIWRYGKVVELSPDKARDVARSRRRKS